MSPWWGKSTEGRLLHTESHRNSRLSLTAGVFLGKVPGFLACLLSSTEYCEHVKNYLLPFLLATSTEYQDILSSKNLSWACNGMNAAQTEEPNTLEEEWSSQIHSTDSAGLVWEWTINFHKYYKQLYTFPCEIKTHFSDQKCIQNTAESYFFFLSSSPQGTSVRCGLSSPWTPCWTTCHRSGGRAAEECTDKGEGRHNANWHSSEKYFKSK